MVKPYGKLRGRIVEIFGSIRDFSKAVKTTEQTIVAKLNGRIPFRQDEIIKWCEALNIDKEQIVEYFFEEILSKLQTT